MIISLPFLQDCFSQSAYRKERVIAVVIMKFVPRGTRESLVAADNVEVHLILLKTNSVQIGFFLGEKYGNVFNAHVVDDAFM
jgi:type III secretory pathway component EscT